MENRKIHLKNIPSNQFAAQFFTKILSKKKHKFTLKWKKNREINLHYDLQMKRLISPISRNFCQKMVREEFSVKLI